MSESVDMSKVKGIAELQRLYQLLRNLPVSINVVEQLMKPIEDSLIENYQRGLALTENEKASPSHESAVDSNSAATISEPEMETL